MKPLSASTKCDVFTVSILPSWSATVGQDVQQDSELMENVVVHHHYGFIATIWFHSALHHTKLPVYQADFRI